MDMSPEEMLASLDNYEAPAYDYMIVDGPGLVHPLHAAIAKPSPELDLSTVPADVVQTAMWKIDAAVKRFNVKAVVVAWDGKCNRAHRQCVHLNYKAMRKPRAPELHLCMAEVWRAGKARGWFQPVFTDYEADDVVASMVKEAKATQHRILIASEDHDLYQLISSSVHQYHLMKDIFCDQEHLEIRALQHSLIHTYMKSLHGDDGDNIPGLPGVGKAAGGAAAQILAEYPEFVVHCVHGKPDWARFSPKVYGILEKAGLKLVHPTKSKEDGYTAPRLLWQRAVVSIVQDTYRLVVLEENLHIAP